MAKNPLLKKLLTNEKGFSLVIALMTLVVLSVLSISIFSISNNTSKAAVWERDDQAVYYIAEAGLVEAKIDLQKIWDSTLTPEENLTVFEDHIMYKRYIKQYKYEQHFTKDTFANITIIPDSVKDQYLIYSEGEIDGNSNTRAVSQTILVNSSSKTVDDVDKIIEIDPDLIPNPTIPSLPPGGEDSDGSDDNDDGKNCQGHGNPNCDRDDDKSDCPPKNKNCNGNDGGSGDDPVNDDDGDKNCQGHGNDKCDRDDDKSDCPPNNPNCNGNDSGSNDDPVNDDDNDDGKNCQGHGNSKCDRDDDKSGCPPSNKNCKDNGGSSDNDSEKLNEIKDQLSCPKTFTYKMPTSQLSGDTFSSLTVTTKQKTKGSITINGNLDIISPNNGNGIVLFVVDGDLTVNGNINFGSNKAQLVVTGKLIVNDINLHNKSEVIVEGEGGAQLLDINKHTSSDHAFVCVKSKLVDIRK